MCFECSRELASSANTEVCLAFDNKECLLFLLSLDSMRAIATNTFVLSDIGTMQWEPWFCYKCCCGAFP